MPRYAAGPDACGIQLITCPYFEKKGSHAMTILVAYVARPEGQAALDARFEHLTGWVEAVSKDAREARDLGRATATKQEG